MTANAFSPSCRILVVSTNTEESKNVIEQIILRSQSVSNGQYDTFEEDESTGGHMIGWTIDNKYYTAPVHFLVQPLALPPAKPLWPPEDDDERVPAIIFVYSAHLTYREQFLKLTEAFDSHDAEVTLAVCTEREEEEGKPQEDADVASDFFTSYGFELVHIVSDDAEREVNSQAVDPYDVTGIPRIINALSTVMWPSLVRKERSSGRAYIPNPGSLISRARAELDEDIDSEAGDLLGVDPHSADRHSSVFEAPLDADDAGALKSLFSTLDGAIADRDLEKLEAWLDGDSDDPWQRSTNSTLPPLTSKTSRTLSEGFDDDFTEFVSALPTPAASSSQPEGVSTSELVDQAFPTNEEIQSTAQRIFGTRTSVPFDSSTGEPAPPKNSDDFDEPFKFDLAEVLGALQAMKEEVGEIDDMDQRRKAAARVALAFASGLGLDERDL